MLVSTRAPSVAPASRVSSTARRRRPRATGRGRALILTRAAEGDRARDPARDEDSRARADTPTFDEARRKFSRDFWEGVGDDRGGVLSLRGRPDPDARAPTEDAAASPASPASPSPDPASVPSSSPTFWQRCTLAGLVIGAWMFAWALASTHWPTLGWIARHPGALAWSPELGWSVLAELTRRLAAPALRYLTAWCAVRSHWRVMWASALASAAVVPVAEGM